MVLPTGTDAVLSPLGISDHSSLSGVMSLTQAVPNFCVIVGNFFVTPIKLIGIQFELCGDVHDLPWRNIWSADKPVEVLNELLSLQIG